MDSSKRHRSPSKTPSPESRRSPSKTPSPESRRSPGTSPSSKRNRSPSKTPSSKRQRSLPVFELLLGTDTELELISDNSTYSFVFYGVKSTGVCFKLNGLSFNQFCMKISLVGHVAETYNYKSVMTLEEVEEVKKYSTKDLIDKEVRIQRRLDAIRMNGGRPIVPYVIDDCYLSSHEFENLGCWEQPNVKSVVDSINQQLQQHDDRSVHMFFMEYIDTRKYKTLAVRIPIWKGKMFKGDKTKEAYELMAANLAVMPGCNVIPYDANENNALVDTTADDLRSIDFGNTYDLERDKDEIVELFNLMLRRIINYSGDGISGFPSLQSLCVFFGIDITKEHITKQHITKQHIAKQHIAAELLERFIKDLDSFVNLQEKGNNTIENIHRNLIMLAFIDFMKNRFGLKQPFKFCRCKNAMEIVYGKRNFEDFFKFTINFSPRIIIEKHIPELDIIQGIIQGIFTPTAPSVSSCAVMGGSNPTFIKRYLPDTLSKRDKIRQSKELTKSRKLYKQRKYYTRKTMRSFKSKPSKHLVRARTMYNIDNIRPSRELSRKSGCSLKGLRQIVKKGEGAYYSSGSRPNQTPQSWGYARLASTITGGNASSVDFHILDKECDHHKPAYRLAQKTSASS